jgi:hypothetical protein
METPGNASPTNVICGGWCRVPYLALDIRKRDNLVSSILLELGLIHKSASLEKLV